MNKNVKYTVYVMRDNSQFIIEFNEAEGVFQVIYEHDHSVSEERIEAEILGSFKHYSLCHQECMSLIRSYKLNNSCLDELMPIALTDLVRLPNLPILDDGFKI